jgi:thioredoxin reductase
MIDVLVIGAGPAGLAAAATLARECSVIVVDRDVEPGGVPRLCHHTGFGWHDLKRVFDGPAYAQRRLDLALDAGASVHVETTVLGWGLGTTVATTSPTSPASLAARAVLLATGCRERPRAARLVAGDRPSGVLTTGSLQQLVHGIGARPGNRAVVVGAEHVSFSAVQTLREAGCEVVAMTTVHRQHQSYAPFAWWTTRMQVPLLPQTELVAVHGKRRVDAVTVRDTATGAWRDIACDTVVFTGDWIPDHELARLGGLEIDAGTKGPAVDAMLRTSRPNVFAAGNLLHGAEMADVAALEGVAAARSIRAHLATVTAWPRDRVSIAVEPPLVWVAPNRIVAEAGAPPRGRFVFRVATFLRDAHVAVEQGGHVLLEQRFPRLVPNRWYHLDASWVGRVDPTGGPVRAGVLAD